MSSIVRPVGYFEMERTQATRRRLLLAWIVQLVSMLVGVIGYEAVRVLFALMVTHVLVR